MIARIIYSISNGNSLGSIADVFMERILQMNPHKSQSSHNNKNVLCDGVSEMERHIIDIDLLLKLVVKHISRMSGFYRPSNYQDNKIPFSFIFTHSQFFHL